MGQHKSKETTTKESKPIPKKVKKEHKYKQVMSDEDVEAFIDYVDHYLEKNGFH